MSRSKSLRLLMVLATIGCLSSPVSAGMIFSNYDSADAPAAKGKPAKALGPEIDLFTVALHEFGHSLGLAHSNPNDGIPAVMDPYYPRSPYSTLLDEDIKRIQGMYPGTAGPVTKYYPDDWNPWADTAITYSFTPDGARMDQGRNTLFSTLDKAIGSGKWQGIFEAALTTWAEATTRDGTQTVLAFTEHSDSGLPFNYYGLSQGDANSGDIRIAAHTFDGPSGILAHAYYPPPSGWTAAGDAHFDKAENWKDLRGALSAYGDGGGASPGTGQNLNSSASVLLGGAAVPEPSTVWLLCVGGLCLIGYWWRKRKR